MLFTGATTIGMIGTIGEEGAEDTVFHVEHGHMLMDSDFKPLAGTTTD